MFDVGGHLPSVVVELGALFLYAPAVVLLHELGHALAAKPGGYRVTSFGIGFGRTLWRTRLGGGVVVHIGRWFLAGGACTAIPTQQATGRRALFHAGGLIAQVALAAILMLFEPHWLIDRIMQFNLLVAIMNATPWRVGGTASDGWYLLDAATGGRRGGSLLAQRPELERLAQREAEIGSPIGSLWADLCLAWIDIQLEAPHRADAFFQEDPPETAVDPWIDAVYHAVRADWHRLSGRPLPALRAVRDTRAARLDELSLDAEGLLTLAEARALLDLDSAAVAERVLARVIGHTGPVARQASAVLLRAALEQPSEELEFATWRVLRRTDEAWLDPAEASATLWQAADKLESHGRVEASAGARNAARRMARRTLSRAALDDRAALLRRLGPAAGQHSPQPRAVGPS